MSDLPPTPEKEIRPPSDPGQDMPVQPEVLPPDSAPDLEPTEAPPEQPSMSAGGGTFPHGGG
jgi:hypothetical protein